MTGAHRPAPEDLMIPIDEAHEMYVIRFPDKPMRIVYRGIGDVFVREQQMMQSACRAHLDDELRKDILGALADRYLKEL